MFKGEFKQNELPPYSPINPSASLGKFFYFSNKSKIFKKLFFLFIKSYSS